MERGTKGLLAALQNIDFRYFLSVRFFATFASQMTSTLMAWQVYKLTRDPLSLGLIGLFEVLPFMSVTLFAGHYVDRLSRRKIIIIADAVLLICSIVLAIFSFSNILKTGSWGVWPIYLINIITGVGRAFLFPAMTALRANIIKGELIQNSIAWNVNIWYTAAIAGPALAGILYDLIGVGNSYIVASVFFLIAIISIFKIKEPGRSESQTNEDIWTSLRQGIHFVFNRKIILGAITLDLFAVLFGGVVALLPVFATEILKVNATGLGILRAAPFIGALLSGIFLAAKPLRAKVGLILLACVGLFGISNLCFSFSTNLYLSAFFMALSGAFDNVSVFIRHTIMQLYVPDNMRGRVSAVEGIFISSSNELGSFESGFAAKIMGLIPSVVFGTSMTFLSVGITTWFAPDIKGLDWSNGMEEE
ncbi:MAG TPA: MFS transporter [Saprospiraceae bacterium]|nr:MFS transporter [Saprospiraceae bacterium]